MTTKQKGGAGIQGNQTRVVKEKYKGKIRETIVGFFQQDAAEEKEIGEKIVWNSLYSCSRLGENILNEQHVQV